MTSNGLQPNPRADSDRLPDCEGSYDPDQLLTAEEVARLLTVQPSTLKKWRGGKGRLGPPFVKLGRRVAYRRRDVRAFVNALIASNTVEAYHMGAG